MKRFFTVYEFELKSYMKNKSFVITTIVLAVLLFGVMFLPRVFDVSDMLGTKSNQTENTRTGNEDGVVSKGDEAGTKIGLVDEKGLFADTDALQQAFGEDVVIVKVDNVKELSDRIKEEELAAGFDVKDDLHYEYYVLNREMFDENQVVFEEVLTTIHQQQFCEEQGIDYTSFMQQYNAEVDCTEKILGKDAEDNYWYCYALVIVIFMMIILYGVMVATSVTVEKSNRSIEVLVTSIDAKYLLFGKVFAGATAAIVQLGLILGAVLGGYAINHVYWGDALDMILDIPGSVLGGFAVFGIGGFLFYAFLYGAMGALVSKTEDINKSAGTLQLVIMLVYFAVLFQLQNPDGIVMKVCSFLPFSSYSAMFVRIGMGTVAVWEIVVSAVILFASIFGVGWLAAKIYRMGTLRYGNPIKLSTAIKNLKE